jgi:predicted nucleic acid-binding protein
MNRPLVTCEAVIAEACYLLRSIDGAPEAIVENVENGVFQIPLSLSRSAGVIRRIVKKYRRRPADFADACLICLAQELNTDEILTLDSDFRIYRWNRTRPFRLLISLD